MEKEPIISKWHKGKEIEDKKITDVGFVSGETGRKLGVHRKVFETTEGKKYYVYKEVADLLEAREIMQIHQIFKQAGLPVADFAKIIKKRIEGKDEFIVAMEDLTDNGRLFVTEELRTDIPAEIKEKMVRALAIIHNNDICDYHPGLSFALRERRPEGEKPEVVDFKIIDYANFENREMIERWEKENRERQRTFKEECHRDLLELLRGISARDGDYREHLVNIYWDARERGDKFLKEAR